ncbi:MAG: hypothetical protein EOP07_18085 [Proteobacteria bacterium]|nr:MAG: hypothetical protein EOP07_18085 [Pseudomonadota bacterium]
MKSKILATIIFTSLFTLTSVASYESAFAQAKKKEAKDSGGGRKKIITQEGRAKGSSKTNIDFDAAAIDGERRIPAGVAIGGAKQDNQYDLINLRLIWHPEMVKSTSNLETGKGQ